MHHTVKEKNKTTGQNARVHSFIRFTSPFLQLSFSLSMQLLPRMNGKSRKYQRVFKVKGRAKTEPVVRKCKRPLLACHTRCKCSLKLTHNSVRVKLGIKVMKLVSSLIGWEVSVGQGSECYMRLFIAE